jgi:flagellar hook assembly protein FlgD
LAIHDLAGRRVALLVDGISGKGPGKAEWGGLDESGKPVAAGQYLVRLEAEDRVDVQKILLVR